MTHRIREPLLLILVLMFTGALSAPQGSTPGTDNTEWSALQGSMERMHDAMMSVEQTGDGDVQFAELMIPHHQAALEMAKAELQYGKDPQMRRLAQEIVADQQSEIELMQLWLKQHPGKNK